MIRQTACTLTSGEFLPLFHNFVFKGEYLQDGSMMSSYNVKLRRVGIADYDAQIKGRRDVGFFACLFLFFKTNQRSTII